MSTLAIAAQVKAGEQLLAEINRVGTGVEQTAQAVVDAASAYVEFRASLGGDADDEAYADERFAAAVDRAKAKFTNATPEVRAVIDQFFAGLGYAKK